MDSSDTVTSREHMEDSYTVSCAPTILVSSILIFHRKMNLKQSDPPSGSSPQRTQAPPVERAPSLLSLLVAGSLEQRRRDCAAISGILSRRVHHQHTQRPDKSLFPPALSGALTGMSVHETLQAAIDIIGTIDREEPFGQDDEEATSD